MSQEKQESKLSTFTMQIDERMDQTLEELKEHFHKTSKADVIRMGVRLLKIANDVLAKGQKIGIADKNGKFIREILIA